LSSNYSAVRRVDETERRFDAIQANHRQRVAHFESRNPTLMTATDITYPKIVTRGEWLAERKKFLAREKAFTKERDALNAERRRLPMVEIDKEYVFEGPQGKVRLADLFEDRHQLIVYHFMFEPGDPPPGKSGEPFDEGCSGCSFVVDNLGYLAHFHARDTSVAVVSRAPIAKIQPFKARMGWKVPWVSSFGSDFNYDFHVTTDEAVAPVEYNYQDKATLERKEETYHLHGEQPGMSVFLRDDDGRIFHAYSTYGRGLDMLMGTYHWLDHTPFGRQEEWEDSPEGFPQTPTHGWLRHHDKYEDATSTSESCCGSRG
jgi:predicted dithiol-disulfide oxidoreductase (DUF899 family)